MPYVYRVSRRTELNRQPATAGVTVSAVSAAQAPVGPTYRALQAQAKALGIPGKQKAGKLRKAIAEATNGG